MLPFDRTKYLFLLRNINIMVVNSKKMEQNNRSQKYGLRHDKCNSQYVPKYYFRKKLFMFNTSYFRLQGNDGWLKLKVMNKATECPHLHHLSTNLETRRLILHLFWETRRTVHVTRNILVLIQSFNKNIYCQL